MMKNKDKLQALYVHIPFCSKICTYCDFYKMVAKPKNKIQYVDYLVKEIDLKKSLFNDISTVYIGGGTPSSLPHESLDKLLSTLWENLDFKKVTEFTIEANPNDINKEFIYLIKKHHINRVSLGVQSFNTRNHTAEDAINAIKLLQNSGIKNINADIIYATPEDSFKVVKKDLKYLTKLKIPHISAYSLILEDKTVLHYRYDKKLFTMLDEDREFVIYKKLNRFLHNKGYHQYEISNYSKPNMESKHNLVYWNNNHYLGIGAGASYYIDNVRYTNIMNLEKYYRGIDEENLQLLEKKQLTFLEQMQEEMILGLRKVSGVSISHFKKKFNKDIYSVFPIIRDLINQQLLVNINDNIYIPKSKLYLSNTILVHFV